MSITNNKIRLREANIPLTFGFSISPKDEKVTLKYSGKWENEVFYNIYSFLDAFSQYYRNRIDEMEGLDEKINLSNGFLDTIQGYKLDLRDAVKDREKFFNEIELYKERFSYYKSRFIEVRDRDISKNFGKTKQNFSIKQQILILEYMGALELLKQAQKEKQNVQIISLVIGKSFENTKKALANNYKPVLKGKSTKTKRNLEAVRDLFIDNNLLDLANKVQEDIDTIK